jgi:hypothetical protein
MSLFVKLLKPLLLKNSFNFLRGDNEKKHESLMAKKISKLSNSNLGKKLGITRNTCINEIPLTGYNYYRPFFMNPSAGDFIYPLKEYVRVQTSGTMGKPKTFLLAKKGIMENVKTTALSFFSLVTHDGDEIQLDFGDTIYANIPGGNFFASFLADAIRNSKPQYFKLVPNQDLPFKEKVDFFVNNHHDINIGYMTVTTFLDEIYPLLNDDIYLKGFFTQDMSAGPLKDELKKKTGNYPKTIFAATESQFTGLPSIQYPGAFFFDWRCIYPEFIPENDAVNSDVTLLEEPPTLLKMHEVEKGRRYQLIVTPFINDLTRYIMPDILECVSKTDETINSDIPVFKYYARSDRVIVLHNFTRINEEELINIMKDTNIPFVDFTARRELEGSKEYLSLYLELNEKMDIQVIHKLLDKEFLEFDKDWKDLSGFMNYTPLKIHLLPKGTFKKFLHNKEGMARIQRIGMREERLQQLLGYA